MTKTIRGSGIGKRGAALIIALTAALVVMLSVMLLLGYISGMVDTQRTLEDRAQARLTESSSVEGLHWLLREDLIDDYSNLPDFSVGTMTTVFDVDDIRSTAPRELRIVLYGYEDPVLLPSGEGLFIAGIRDGMLVLDLLDPLTGRSVQGYPVQVCGAPGQWDAAAGTFDDIPVAFVVTSNGINDVVYCIHHGTLTSFETDVVTWTETSLFSVGGFGCDPALLVTNGWNWGQLILPETGWTYYGLSPAGTCPVFLPDGSIYGHFSPDQRYGFSGTEVIDTFEGDFNRDGIPDVAWAGPSSLAFLSGLTGELILDSGPWGVLVAWGSVEGRFGLGGCWMDGSGDRAWRRLSYNGFQDYPSGGVLDYDWFGRIEGLNNLIIGVVGDSLGIASMDLGELTLVCPAGSGFMGDIDGSTSDIIFIDGNEINLVMNPLDGEGLLIQTLASTHKRDRVITGNGWDFYVYGTGENRRVFVEGEGIDL